MAICENMTQEQKAKAYDKIRDRAKKELGACGSQDCDAARQIFRLFPELKESEDERIRKDLCKAIWTYVPTEEGQEYIAWLEKQGEQKPAWSEEDERKLQLLTLMCDETKGDSAAYSTMYREMEELKSWLKSLKDMAQSQPKHEWSEEDKNRINRLIAYFEDKESFTAEDDVVYANWLKSLRPQSQWKPSDEQITWLYRAADDATIDSRMKQILKELLSDLKKLREE